MVVELDESFLMGFVRWDWIDIHGDIQRFRQMHPEFVKWILQSRWMGLIRMGVLVELP